MFKLQKRKSGKSKGENSLNYSSNKINMFDKIQKKEKSNFYNISRMNLKCQNLMIWIHQNEFNIDENINYDFINSRLDELKQKLLDPSRRNPLVNFSHSGRSMNYLRVVDEVPDILIQKLSSSSMQFKALPDFDEVPPDEKTQEFLMAFSASQSSDEEYIEALEELGDEPDPEKLNKIQRDLKDRVRALLGLKSIDRGGSPNLSEHAKLHGFNPDYNLLTEVKSEAHEDNFIQTLLVPDDLEKTGLIRSRYRSNEETTGMNFFKLVLVSRMVENKDDEKILSQYSCLN